MSFYFIRKMTAPQGVAVFARRRSTHRPTFLASYVYMIKYFMTFIYIEIFIFGCKKKRWVYELLLYKKDDSPPGGGSLRQKTKHP